MLRLVTVALVLTCTAGGAVGVAPQQPYDRQVAAQTTAFRTGPAAARAKAAEALGFLRAYAAEEVLLERLRDESVEVRRQVAMALAWCGSRRAVPALIDALDDADWLTRQAAHVSLTNLTGMEFPFDALTAESRRAEQAAGVEEVVGGRARRSSARRRARLARRAETAAGKEEASPRAWPSASLPAGT